MCSLHQFCIDPVSQCELPANALHCYVEEACPATYIGCITTYIGCITTYIGCITTYIGCITGSSLGHWATYGETKFLLVTFVGCTVQVHCLPQQHNNTNLFVCFEHIRCVYTSVLIRIECALNSHSIAIVSVHTECTFKRMELDLHKSIHLPR